MYFLQEFLKRLIKWFLCVVFYLKFCYNSKQNNSLSDILDVVYLCHIYSNWWIILRWFTRWIKSTFTPACGTIINHAWIILVSFVSNTTSNWAILFLLFSRVNNIFGPLKIIIKLLLKVFLYFYSWFQLIGGVFCGFPEKYYG